MDRIIEKKGRSPLQWVLLAAGVLVVLFIGWQLFARTGSSRLKVDPTRLTTAVVEKGRWKIQAGAGIVADSVAENEYAEAEAKAAALFRALDLAREWFA